MNAGVEVITQTLAEHRLITRRIKHPWRDGLLLNITACAGCDWGDEETSESDYRAHVAEAVVAALELHEEWAVKFSEPTAYTKATTTAPTDEILQRTRDFFPGREWVSRLVTQWAAVAIREQPTEGQQ